MAEKFAAITALADAFCAMHLNEEYRVLIHRLIGSLARRRPPPLLKGKESVWAAAAAHAVGRMADNPLVWMLEVNGLVIDIRQAPAELQRR